MCRIIVGTLTSTVGRNFSIFENRTSGVHRSGKRAAAAPTEKGKKRFEPVAYPKKSFGTESVTSDSVRPRTRFP